MSITVGKSVARVDAFDKVTGRTKYYEDRMPAGALYIRIKHAEIAHGFVKSVDTAAEDRRGGEGECAEQGDHGPHCGAEGV